ncbi:DNA transfer protein [Maribacter phage Panino]
MKYKNLTSSEIKWIEKLYASKEPRKEIQKTIAKKFGVRKRTVRDWAKKLEIVNKPPAEFVVAQKKILKEKAYYLITWGQNSTPVHEGFLRNLQAYASFLDAEISVIAGRYRNPTSVFPDSDKEIWAKEILPYLDASRHSIHEYFEILSDIKIHPTAKIPLSSFEGVSSQRSCVIGHPRVHMKVVPALNGYKPKMMLTTGACTVRNYTDSKAGKIGEFHHTLGFVIVEIDGDDFYVRQVTADEDTGAFTDLNKYVSKGVVKQAEQAEAIIFGDIHVGDHDPRCIESTLEICEVLQPKKLCCMTF